MTERDNVLALADRIESFEEVILVNDDGPEWSDKDRLTDDEKEILLAILRSAAAPAATGDVREALTRRIELARSFIAREYNDPAQELRGDWIDPRARPAHDALCLCLQDLAALSAAPVERGREKITAGKAVPMTHFSFCKFCGVNTDTPCMDETDLRMYSRVVERCADASFNYHAERHFEGSAVPRPDLSSPESK